MLIPSRLKEMAVEGHSQAILVGIVMVDLTLALSLMMEGEWIRTTEILMLVVLLVILSTNGNIHIAYALLAGLFLLAVSFVIYRIYYPDHIDQSV